MQTGKQKRMEQTLSVLYGISGIASSALYVPQILKYHRDPAARRAISLFAWGGWIAMTMVTILYASYVVKSRLFASVACLNVSSQTVVLLYGISARLPSHKRRLAHKAEDKAHSAA